MTAERNPVPSPPNGTATGDLFALEILGKRIKVGLQLLASVLFTLVSAVAGGAVWAHNLDTRTERVEIAVTRAVGKAEDATVSVAEIRARADLDREELRAITREIGKIRQEAEAQTAVLCMLCDQRIGGRACARACERRQ